MAVPFSIANAAYGQTQRLVSDSQGLLNQSGKAASAADMPDFGALVAEAVNSVVETGRTSDALSADLVNGKANIVDVVTAVSETELAIEGLVAVRDKVISAYESILNMPI